VIENNPTENDSAKTLHEMGKLCRQGFRSDRTRDRVERSLRGQRQAEEYDTLGGLLPFEEEDVVLIYYYPVHGKMYWLAKYISGAPTYTYVILCVR